MPNKLSQFWHELKRRRVVHVIVVYATAAFVIIELINNITEPLSLPDWTPTFVIIILFVGFPLAIIFSWIFDVTPEGIEKTKPAKELQKDEKSLVPNSWRIATYVSGVVILGLLAYNIFGGSNKVKIDESLLKSVAVLPFRNLSGDLEQEHICEGLADEIINHLYKVASFDKVSPLASTRVYKDDSKGIREIADELQVNYIMYGTYKRLDNSLRISANLIETKNERQVWQQNYDMPYKDIVGVPGEITIQIADHLKAFLTDDEQQSIGDYPTNNPEAYNLYLKAHYFQNTRSREGLAKSVEYYQKAIHLDTDYAIAYSGLAISYTLQVFNGHVRGNENLLKAKEAAAKALELNDKLGEAHLSLGMVAWLEGDLYSMVQELKLSILLNPNNADAHHWYSYILPVLGKTEEAIKEAKIALELEPLNPVMMRGLGKVYYFDRQYDQAIIEITKCLEIDPGQKAAYLFFSYFQKEMFDDAISTLERILIIDEFEDIALLIRQTYEESGFNIAIRQLLDLSLEKSIGFGSSQRMRSRLFAAIGDTDKALEWCVYDPYNLKVDPIYDSIRSDLRFQDIVDRMNFPDN